jgi:hypothetical protein
MNENEDGPRGAGNTTGGLTHSLDYTEEGLAMKATHERSRMTHERTRL